ncbi:hypothetical protein GF337_08920 [candidate division KSB1 bacterium]|nr:hypothetical protein [candidate division KSB1 bacterium]
MKKIIDKKYLPYMLAVLAVLIWGHNGYRIFHGLLHLDNISENTEAFHWTPQVIAAETQLTAKPFIYEANHRDPFKNWLQVARKSASVHQKRQQKRKLPPTPPPALRLTGILGDANGTMAIIEFPNGAVHFVREKDIIDNITIIKIESNAVLCRFEKQEFKVELVR